MNLKSNKILITGGASGIGLGFAEKFITLNNTVIVCGRREDALEAARKKFPSIITKQCDLTNEKERQHLTEWVYKEHSDTNVLINNAGIQQWMSVYDKNFYHRAMEEININIIALIHLTHLFLDLKSLHTIMNVSSGLSFVPLIKTPVYSATKSFVHSFTTSLRELVKDRKIEVIEIIPPALNTDLGGKGIHDFAPPVSEFIESVFGQLKEGKTELTFGFTESSSKAGQEILLPVFKKMNQVQ